jgi:hypothetical protein
MAAPVVGGAAAIVRQYFAEGFYPSGSRKKENSYPEVSGEHVSTAPACLLLFLQVNRGELAQTF